YIELDKSGIPYERLSKYKALYSPTDLVEIENQGEKFSRYHFDKPDYDTIFYYGISIVELIHKYGEEKAMILFQEKGRQVFEPYEFSLRLLQFINPDKVFVTCGQRMELTIARAANELGIKVIRLVDLVIENLKVPYKCTLCVVNPLAKKYLSQSNEHIDDIYITGNPNFSYDYKVSNSEIELKTISLFTQPGDFDIEMILMDFYRIANEMVGYKFILRPHPSEELDRYKQLMVTSPSNFELDYFSNSKDIIARSRCVFTFFSSVGMEAIMQNKNLFVLNYRNFEYPVDYVKMGCAKLITDFSSLHGTFRSIGEGDFETFYRRGFSLIEQPKNCIDLLLKVILEKHELSDNTYK
ncbi:hypothetical protein, partial [Vibrio splendidus]|uniref:hypothetical protein n=1 Tax=Vibrio splendidus TaxID=29497 RepID=UPI0024686EEC